MLVGVLLSHQTDDSEMVKLCFCPKKFARSQGRKKYYLENAVQLSDKTSLSGCSVPPYINDIANQTSQGSRNKPHQDCQNADKCA